MSAALASKTPSRTPPSLPPLCQAVKTIRQRYQESQASFAQRVGLIAMTISKFERGETVPRDPAVLQSLSGAAEAVGMNIEAEQFAAACKEALSIETVNRMYPGPLTPAAQPGLAIAFQTLPEWRLAMVALSAVRYDPAVSAAIEAAGGPVRAIIDQILQNADTGRGIGPDFFRDLENRIKMAMDERSLKQIPRTAGDRGAR